MAAKLTRRGLALAAVPLMIPPAALPQATSTEDDLTVQGENVKRWREQIMQVKLPMSTEPASIFKA